MPRGMNLLEIRTFKIVHYPDLRDPKGKMPGHHFQYGHQLDGEWWVNVQPMRDDRHWGASRWSGPFRDAESAVDYLDHRTARAAIRVYSNKLMRRVES